MSKETVGEVNLSSLDVSISTGCVGKVTMSAIRVL